MPRRLSLSAFKAVLFDIDGTLVDSLGMLVKGLGDVFEEHTGSRPEDAKIRSVMGMPLRRQFDLFLPGMVSDDNFEDMQRKALDRYRAHQSLELIIPEAVEALVASSRAGLRTALVTSKTDLELLSFIERHPWTSCADTVVCASDVTHPKPHPESALVALARLGVEPAEAVFIGDSMFDVECGRSAGLATIAVSFGACEGAALASAGPDMLIATPAELLGWALESLSQPTCQEKN